MIALSVLSVLLIIATVIMMQIGRLYTKGVNAANLQNTNRNVMTDITSLIEFSGTTPVISAPSAPYPANADTHPALTSVNAFCLGTTRYSYVLDRELGQDSSSGNATAHVLWRDTIPGGGGCTPLDLSHAGTPSGSGEGYEMVQAHMRLTKLTVTETPANSGVYTVDAWMAYGDQDLVNTDTTTRRSTCNGGAGTEFCSISELTTAIKRRVD